MFCAACNADCVAPEYSEGNSICPDCGTVLEESQLSANIEFTKKGSRFHVIGAFVSQNHDRLPVQVLKIGRVGNGSNALYKWTRMKNMMLEVKTMVEQVGLHFREVENRLRNILRDYYGDNTASLGKRARKIYGGAILHVLDEREIGLTTEDCSAMWKISTADLIANKEKVTATMSKKMDFSSEACIARVKASLAAAMSKIERRLFPAAEGSEEKSIPHDIKEILVQSALEVYDMSVSANVQDDQPSSAALIAALLVVSINFTSSDVEKFPFHKQLSEIMTVSSLSQLMNVQEDAIEKQLEEILVESGSQTETGIQNDKSESKIEIDGDDTSTKRRKVDEETKIEVPHTPPATTPAKPKVQSDGVGLPTIVSKKRSRPDETNGKK